MCRSGWMKAEVKDFEKKRPITEAGLRRLQNELKNAIVPEEDTIVIYELDSCKYVYKSEIGLRSDDTSVI